MQAFAPSLAIVPAIRAGFNPDHRGPLEKQIVLFHSNRASEAKLSGNFSVAYFSLPASLPVPERCASPSSHGRKRLVSQPGEAVACDGNGMPSFDRIRYRRHDASVFLYAFDLIELNGDDLRREPLDTRKATLASVWGRPPPGLRPNDPTEPDGPPGSATPARWSWRASSQNGRRPTTAVAVRPTGSRARTRLAKRFGVRKRRIGGDDS